MKPTPAQPPPGPDAPRAFTRASGTVLQLIGAVLAVGSCCWWSFAGWTQERVGGDGSLRSVGEVVRAAGAERIWGMCGIVVSFAGGLGLAALGLGLQGEKPAAGRAAGFVAGAGALFWLSYLAWSIITQRTFGGVVVGLLMFLAWGLSLTLALISADELRRFPPPPDLGKAPPDLKPDRLIDRELPEDLRDMR